MVAPVPQPTMVAERLGVRVAFLSTDTHNFTPKIPPLKIPQGRYVLHLKGEERKGWAEPFAAAVPAHRRMIDHDARPGPLERCQISGSDNLHLVIDLGHQPPCDALLEAEDLKHPETDLPAAPDALPGLGLAQLDYVVPGDEIYPPTIRTAPASRSRWPITRPLSPTASSRASRSPRVRWSSTSAATTARC
jgi:hypothetical protein